MAPHPFSTRRIQAGKRQNKEAVMSATIDYAALPKLREGELARWRTGLYGDGRDDVRAALSAGSDASDDLQLVGFALEALGEEPVEAERQQAILRSASGLLHERLQVLQSAFYHLWNCAHALNDLGGRAD